MNRNDLDALLVFLAERLVDYSLGEIIDELVDIYERSLVVDEF